jgi:hypothetical protein
MIHGITLTKEERDMLYATYPQDGKCECCGRDPQPGRSRHGVFERKLTLDHSGTTFRGWLCSGCNSGIGMLGDDESGLLRALAYLRHADLSTS